MLEIRSIKDFKKPIHSYNVQNERKVNNLVGNRRISFNRVKISPRRLNCLKAGRQTNRKKIKIKNSIIIPYFNIGRTEPIRFSKMIHMVSNKPNFLPNQHWITQTTIHMQIRNIFYVCVSADNTEIAHAKRRLKRHPMTDLKANKLLTQLFLDTDPC